MTASLLIAVPFLLLALALVGTAAVGIYMVVESLLSGLTRSEPRRDRNR